MRSDSATSDARGTRIERFCLLDGQPTALVSVPPVLLAASGPIVLAGPMELRHPIWPDSNGPTTYILRSVLFDLRAAYGSSIYLPSQTIRSPAKLLAARVRVPATVDRR